MAERVTFEDLTVGDKIIWEWNRDGPAYTRYLKQHNRPIGTVVDRQDGSLGVRLHDDGTVVIPVQDLEADGHRLWAASGGLYVRSSDESSDLANRLRGIYNIPINDGAGLLDGKSVFTRHFETSPIMKEAADRIELLESLLIDAAQQARYLLNELESATELDPERSADERAYIKAAMSALLPEEFLAKLVPDRKEDDTAPAP